MSGRIRYGFPAVRTINPPFKEVKMIWKEIFLPALLPLFIGLSCQNTGVTPPKQAPTAATASTPAGPGTETPTPTPTPTGSFATLEAQKKSVIRISVKRTTPTPDPTKPSAAASTPEPDSTPDSAITLPTASAPGPTPAPTSMPSPAETSNPAPDETRLPPPDNLLQFESGHWLTRVNPDIARKLLDLPWVKDGLSPEEKEELQYLVYIAPDYAADMALLLEKPWVRDGTSKDELDVMGSISSIAYK